MDAGDVVASGLSLANCCMLQWRSNVRYVTQYKVDIPGTPREFIMRISSFSSYNLERPDDIVLQALNYLQCWGMGDDDYSYEDASDRHHHYLDKDWKSLSGGESQRMILAIAMASRPQILLLDEATAGLDNETEKRVEISVVNYVRQRGACALWVTHSEDIAERLSCL